MVDLIYRPVESPVTDATLRDTVMRPVEAIEVPVITSGMMPCFTNVRSTPIWAKPRAMPPPQLRPISNEW